MYILAALGLFLKRVFSSCSEQGLLFCLCRVSHLGGFSYCGEQALGGEGFSSFGARVQWLWLVGLVALWHVESSRTKD